ncbi:TolC family protein [Thermithiobacillus plumbiphilus]|uniref:TolC family protein n=1 Tax=Thermithiobacillus plumbiphilus TaxID=1729899 RepID=A0ABU9D5M1_9PROT
MSKKRLLLSLLASFLSVTVQAQEIPPPPDLPSTTLARQVLDQDPGVRAARAALEAGRTEAQLYATGPYEFSTRLSGQQRDLRGGSNYGEWSVGIERPVRLPGKAALDRGIGQQVVAEMDARYGDALHQASRELLRLWLSWRGAEATRELLSTQRLAAEENLRAVEKRFKAGDAARLDVHLAEAEFEELRRAENEADTGRATSLARLQGRFPGIQAVSSPLGNPRPLENDPAFWRERILAHSHELLIPKAQLARAVVEARRARAERIPDPTLGAYAASEFGGAERILGLSVSIPIPGDRRRLEAARAESLVQGARAQLNLQTRSVETEISAALAQAQGTYQSWQAADRAAQAMRNNAQLMQRAYELGEADLQALLLARRQALSAQLAANKAQIETLLAHYLLLVDGHLIWNMEASDHED